MKKPGDADSAILVALNQLNDKLTTFDDRMSALEAGSAEQAQQQRDLGDELRHGWCKTAEDLELLRGEVQEFRGDLGEIQGRITGLEKTAADASRQSREHLEKTLDAFGRDLDERLTGWEKELREEVYLSVDQHRQRMIESAAADYLSGEQGRPYRPEPQVHVSRGEAIVSRLENHRRKPGM